MRKFLSFPRDSHCTEWFWYKGDCVERNVPFVLIQTYQFFADITWCFDWLDISGYSKDQKSLSDIGIQVHQLFERCRDRKSYCHVGHNLGYLKRIRIDYAERVAVELFEIFSQGQ